VAAGTGDLADAFAERLPDDTTTGDGLLDPDGEAASDAASDLMWADAFEDDLDVEASADERGVEG
jgi:hypothetical protein